MLKNCVWSHENWSVFWSSDHIKYWFWWLFGRRLLPLSLVKNEKTYNPKVTAIYVVLPNENWFRSSHRRCLVRKGVLRNFAKFTGKHPHKSLRPLYPLKSSENCTLHPHYVKLHWSFSSDFLQTTFLWRKSYFLAITKLFKS